MVEAAGSLGQSLILVKYLVFLVIPAGIKLKSVQKSTVRRVRANPPLEPGIPPALASEMLGLPLRSCVQEPGEVGVSSVRLNCPLPGPLLPMTWSDHMVRSRDPQPAQPSLEIWNGTLFLLLSHTQTLADRAG